MAALCLTVSCYEKYAFDYEYSMVGFAIQNPLRTVISDRDMEIRVGVYIGGKREADLNDWADFEIDPALLDDTGLTLLPENYYVFDDSKFRVRQSNMPIADAGIKFTDDFYNDPLATGTHYALPLRIAKHSLDSIYLDREYSIVAIKFASTYSGTYYYRGRSTRLDAAGMPTEDVEQYGSSVLAECNTRIFETISPNVVVRRGMANQGNSAQNRVQLTVYEDSTSPTGYSVRTDTAPGSTLVISGGGTWDPDADRAVFNLDYTYSDGSNTFHVEEELIRRQDPYDALRVENW